GPHHAGEADDREAIADLELARVAEGQGGEIHGFDAPQRGVAPRHRLPRGGRAVLGDPGRQTLAVGQDDPDRWSQLDVVGRQRGYALTRQLVFEVWLGPRSH